MAEREINNQNNESAVEQKEKLPFAKNEVYRLMRQNLDYPYTNIERINEEKERILLHLNSIKADCDALAMDVEKTLKLNDRVDNDSFTDFSSQENEE